MNESKESKVERKEITLEEAKELALKEVNDKIMNSRLDEDEDDDD